MDKRAQPDLFGKLLPDLFDPAVASTMFRADPDRVRARLDRILAQARSAAILPRRRAEVACTAPSFRR